MNCVFQKKKKKSARCGASAGSQRPHHPRLGDGQPPGAGERLSPDAPRNGEGSSPREATSRATPTTGGTRPQQGLAASPTNRRLGKGERLTPDAPHNGESSGSPQAHHWPSGRSEHMQDSPTGPGQRPPCTPAMLGASPQKCTMRSPRQALQPASHHTHSTGRKTGRYRDRKTTRGPYPVPALRHSDTAMADPTAPRKTRPQSPALDAAHEVIRGLRLQCRGGDPPPPEDTDTDSNLELIPEAPTGGASAGPTAPAGIVQALCSAWKWGHRTGEGWCPMQHPRPAANDGALPAVGYAAARAALSYGLAQGWIQDQRDGCRPVYQCIPGTMIVTVYHLHTLYTL